MENNKKNPSSNIKPDLKHDSMEFSASTDGDDKLDLDDPNKEDDAISAEELDFLEDDSFDAQAEALNSVEEDRAADNDVIFDESDEGELDEGELSKGD